MGEGDKPLVWLHGEIKTPPMSAKARLEGGYLLRRLQRGELLSMPESHAVYAKSGDRGLSAPTCRL